jgi:dienelactone hydrolase
MQFLDTPVIPVPATLSEWQAHIPHLRQTLWQLLGDVPPLFTPEIQVTERLQRDGYALEKFTFENGAGAMVYGYLLIPDNRAAPAPAIVYHHMHGNKYHIGKDELFQNWLTGSYPGQALVNAGYIVMAIDAYGFGERWHQGAWGTQESGVSTELSLFKKFLWQGSTLWGMMVRDDVLALNALLARPEVDAQRIGVTGMSLGGSRTTWLAALDERPKVVIPVAQMTRYRNFLAKGNINQHGIYYYVPGILKDDLRLDMELIAALTAPRPQVIISGDSDPLSPLEGIQLIVNFTGQIYRLYHAEAQFQAQLFPGVAHKYTPEMFAAMLVAFEKYL